MLLLQKMSTMVQHCNNTLAYTGFQHYWISALNNSKSVKMKNTKIITIKTNF
jgi:hypothetical protein